MDQQETPDQDLLHQLPLPLGQLYRRCVNATSVHSRHSMAYYLWQSGLQLLASSCIVEFEAISSSDAKAPDSLKSLACPSTGHFLGMVRELLPLLGTHRESEFGEYARAFEARIDPAFASLNSLAISIHDHVRQTRATKRRTQFSPLDLLTDLVTYRNDEFGHGAVGARSDEFYENMGALLLEGALTLWSHVSPTLGNRLLYVSSVQASERGDWIVELNELIGDQAKAMRPICVPNELGSTLPIPNRMYLCSSQQDLSRPEFGLWRSLHPLVIVEPDSEDVYYLRSRHGKASVSYVSFVSGEHARKVVFAEHRELMTRVLGIEVEQKQVDDWAAKSFAEGGPSMRLPSTEEESLGEFELITMLGSGGMGTVYRAWQPSLGRFVAVKKLHRIGDAKARIRFQREIRALGKVEHPNLVKVYSSGTEQGNDYFSMELVPGADLERVISELHGTAPSDVTVERWMAAVSTAFEAARNDEVSVGTIDEQVHRASVVASEETSARQPVLPARLSRGHIHFVVDVVRQIASATQCLHESEIIHRDIKPGNILVTPDGQAVLTDLGLAQMDQEKTITATRQFVGTVRYSSPEQVYNSSRVDARSDVYSLGATLWELLTLRPFLGLNKDVPTVEQFDRVRRTDPESARRLNANVSGDLATIVSKRVSKDETQRYRTAGELADDLRRWLDGDPVLAQPPSAGYFLKKYAYRYRATLAASSLLFLLALGGVVIAFLSIQSQSARRQQALDDNKRLLALNHLQLGSSRADAGMIDNGIQEMVRGYQMLADGDPLKPRAGAIINNRLNQIGNLLVHPWPIADFAFSGNAKRLLSTDDSGNLLLWDCESFRPLGDHSLADKRATESLTVVALDVNVDGRLLACATSEGIISIMDADVWNERSRVDLKERTANVSPLIEWGPSASDPPPAPVPDDTPPAPATDASAAESRQRSVEQSTVLVRAWDASFGDVTSVKFDREDRLLFTTDNGRLYRIKSVDGVEVIENVFAGEPSNELSISNNGRYLAVAHGYPRQIAIFSLETLQQSNYQQSHPNVQLAEVGPLGRLAVCFSTDHVCVWDVVHGFHQSLGNNPQDLVVSDREGAVVWMLEDQYVYQLSVDGVINNGLQIAQQKSFELRGLGDMDRGLGDRVNDYGRWKAISKSGFSPSQKYVASLISSNVIRLHDLENARGQSGTRITNDFVPDTIYGEPLRARFSQDDRVVGLFSENQVVGIWNINDGKTSSSDAWSQETVDGHVYLRVGESKIWYRPELTGTLLNLFETGKLAQIQTSESGDRWAAVGNAQGYRNAFGVWNRDGSEVMFKAFNREVIHLELAQRKDDLVSIFANANLGRRSRTSRMGQQRLSGECRLWNLQTQKSLVLHSDAVHASFNPPGDQIAVADATGTVYLYDSETGERVETSFPHPVSIDAVGFDSQTQTLICGGSNGSIYLWDMLTGLPLSFPRQVSFDQARFGGGRLNVAFSPTDTFLIATGNSDAQLWAVRGEGTKNVLIRSQFKTRQMTSVQGDTRTLGFEAWLKTLSE